MRKKRKGFTLVELLVVIAIIALLMGILMPALAKVRAIAFRVVCGTNLSGLGKAMLIYANDYEDEFPQAGYRNSVWAPAGRLPNWRGATRSAAYGTPPGQVTVSSSFYLLVKYAEVGPKQFLCRGTDTTGFKLSDWPNTGGLDLIDVWDFGETPVEYCSYSYHSAYNSAFALTTAGSQPGMAVAADRSPWLDPALDQAARAARISLFRWDGSTNEQKAGNALAHQDDGQNVLFQDGHVAFEKRAFCGVMDDNVYTAWPVGTGVNRQQGNPPPDGSALPMHKEDSLLVNEGGGGTPTPPPPPP